MSKTFTWFTQSTGYDFSQTDKKGKITHQKFIIELENFPWVKELIQGNKYETKVSPTLSVKDEHSQAILWVSIAGEENSYGFIVGYIYLKKVKWGFGKIKWQEFYSTEDLDFIKEIYCLFFNRKTKELLATIKTLEIFGQGKTKD